MATNIKTVNFRSDCWDTYIPELKAIRNSTGSLRAERINGLYTPSQFGKLLENDSTRADYFIERMVHARYAVWSYETPIAFTVEGLHGDKIWYMPEFKYSVTTSKHQALVRRALRNEILVCNCHDEYKDPYCKGIIHLV